MGTCSLTWDLGVLLPYIRDREAEGVTCTVRLQVLSKCQPPPSLASAQPCPAARLPTLGTGQRLLVPAGAPRSSARPRRHSATGEMHCFRYTHSRRREGVQLLFLFLQCKICQLGTVDRLPLCHRAGSFNCLPCVRASARVCEHVFPEKGSLACLGRKGANSRRGACTLGCVTTASTSERQRGTGGEELSGGQETGTLVHALPLTSQ